MKAVPVLTVICLFSGVFSDDSNVACSPDEDLLLPVDGDCTKYIECRGGDLKEFQCPSGLVFNPTLKVCDFSDTADCKLSDVVCSPGDDFLLPVDGDSTKFYACRDGNLQVYQCPAGLVFNPTLEVCDWAEDSDY